MGNVRDGTRPCSEPKWPLWSMMAVFGAQVCNSEGRGARLGSPAPAVSRPGVPNTGPWPPFSMLVDEVGGAAVVVAVAASAGGDDISKSLWAACLPQPWTAGLPAPAVSRPPAPSPFCMPKRPASEGARGGDRTGGGTDDEFGPLEDKTSKVVLGKPPFEEDETSSATPAACSEMLLS